VSAARNAGTEAALGEYLRYVDADDVCEPGSTARLRALADPETISYEDTLVRDETSGRSYRISSRLRGSIAVECLLGDFDSRHVSMLFPREVVRRAGPWDPRLRVREDFDFVLRCLEHASVVPGEGTATTYRRHLASATRSERAVEDAERASRLVVRGFFARHPELRGTPTEREAWRRLHNAEARTALHQGRPLRVLRRATPLVRLHARDALRWYYRAARSAVRLSGAATARTTARARDAPQRPAG
jgi:glycosyltransferase involved in cell wall biosynthesis